jgi:hypothetical protein
MIHFTVSLGGNFVCPQLVYLHFVFSVLGYFQCVKFAFKIFVRKLQSPTETLAVGEKLL